jgi:hypothetical protein
MNQNTPIRRREFIQTSASLGAALALGGCAGKTPRDTRTLSAASLVGFRAPSMQTVRIGFIGVGGRGSGLIREFMRCPGVQINAVCDMKPDRAARAQDILVKANLPKPESFSGSDEAYKALNDRNDIDLIINATPWEWHKPISVDAMKKGKHVGIEVPMALNVDDCWELIETAEKHQRHCMLLENCCYGEIELAVLNAVRQNAFGEILHGEGGYLHDLQQVKFNENGEGAWRRKYSEIMNGNLYPTHGLGPVAQCMSINRGDKFDYLVSMSGPSRGLQQYARKTFGESDPRAKAKYVCGDVNTSLIQTAMGKTLLAQHDTNTSRPYSRINNLIGVDGIFCGYPDRVGIGEKWGDIDEFKKKYEHPLVTQTREGAKAGGHGGMDYIMAWRLIDCLHRGLPLDISVYDGASWSCIVELSCRSVANRSKAIDFPDFTRGEWKTTVPSPLAGEGRGEG